jgi:CRISPR-associated endoribonuclease Cas6
MKIVDGLIKMISPRANLFISSPLIDEFVTNFVIGSFENQKVIIYSNYRNYEFRIHQMELIPPSSINNEMKFILYSPMVLSTGRLNQKEEKEQHYLRPDENSEINRILTSNLKNKFKLLNQNEIDCDLLELDWDSEYLQKHQRITKKITINESAKNSVDVIGIQAPFTLKGSADLIKVGYDCGFGEKNSMGFGFAVPV